MPRTLPTDQGWFPRELIAGRYIRIVEIVRDPSDSDWYSSATAYLKDRRAFWSGPDGQGLHTTLNAGGIWVHTDRLKSTGKIAGAGADLRSWGTIGKQGRFSVELSNTDGFLTQMRRGTGGASSGASNEFATGTWENRWARIGIMAYDPDGTLAYPQSVVWLAAGRIQRTPERAGVVTVKVQDDRLHGKLDIPRTVYQNDQSVFEGFRAANHVHGQTKPWLFGHVPIAAGLTVALGYEDATELRGHRIEFYGLDESWQQKGAVSDLTYGDPRLVNGTESHGFLQINTDTGGWRSVRSAYSAMPNGQGFHFDSFNQTKLYLKMDVRPVFADTLRDTSDPISLVTDPENAVDWVNQDTYAEMPARSEVSDPDDSYAFVAIPWPNFGGFELEVEGNGGSGQWRDRDMQPPTPGTEIGMYVYLRYDTQSQMAANGAYVIVDARANLYTGTKYSTRSAEGPARWFQGDAVIDNYYGDRELYQMLHRDNTTDGTTIASPLMLSEFETRQGEGKAILFGVASPNGEGGGGSAIGAGVRCHAVGIRVWGRIDFPESDGWYADALGYSVKADFNVWAAGKALNDTYDSALGVLGLFLDRVLPTQGPDDFNFLVQDTFYVNHGFEVGRQFTAQEDGFKAIDQLCKDSHILMLGSESLHKSIVGNEVGATGHRVQWLPHLPAPVHRFTDKAAPVTSGTADKLVIDYALGALDSGIVPGSVDPYRADLTDVYTKFVYKFRWNPMREEYDGVVTISPTEWDLGDHVGPIAGSWLVQTTIQGKLTKAVAEYQRDPELATLTTEAPWIHDAATAEHHLAFLIQNSISPRYGVRLTTGILPIHVRRGDPVQVDLLDLPDEWNSRWSDVEPGTDERQYIVADTGYDLKKGQISWDLMEVRPLEQIAAIATW